MGRWACKCWMRASDISDGSSLQPLSDARPSPHGSDIRSTLRAPLGLRLSGYSRPHLSKHATVLARHAPRRGSETPPQARPAPPTRVLADVDAGDAYPSG